MHGRFHLGLCTCSPLLLTDLFTRLNWDHFGQDAISSYMAGHSVALLYAQLGHVIGNTTLLTEAYFAEGTVFSS